MKVWKNSLVFAKTLIICSIAIYTVLTFKHLHNKQWQFLITYVSCSNLFQMLNILFSVINTYHDTHGFCCSKFENKNDSAWCSLIQLDSDWLILISLDASWFVDQNVSDNVVSLHQPTFSPYTVIRTVAKNLHQTCIKLQQSTSRLHQVASGCIRSHQAASKQQQAWNLIWSNKVAIVLNVFHRIVFVSWNIACTLSIFLIKLEFFYRFHYCP